MRRFIYWLITLFYPTIEMTGEENLPTSGGMIIVSNHPNGIIDPIPLMIKLKRPIGFLAKSTLWAIPLLRTFLNTFNALPIYRHQDDGKRGGPTGDVAARNEATFTKARILLQTDGVLALFPEGITHSESQLQPLKTGAARIALQNEAEMGWSGEVPIVPIGLWYENKGRFRSSVLLVVGRPFTLDGFKRPYQEDPRATVRTVTELIDAHLDTVVLQAESSEILKALPVVTNWLNQGKTSSLQDQHLQMNDLLIAYEQLQKRDPARLEKIISEMRRYDKLLRAIGMREPWQATLPPIPFWRIFGRLLAFVIATPFALLGLLISYIPYRIAGFVARRAIQDDYTQLSLAKILGGLLFYLFTVLGLAIWFGVRSGLSAVAWFLVLAPFCTLFALWWVERVQSIASRLSQIDWVGRKKTLRAYVLAEQDRVVQLITSAVSEMLDLGGNESDDG